MSYIEHRRYLIWMFKQSRWICKEAVRPPLLAQDGKLIGMITDAEEDLSFDAITKLKKLRGVMLPAIMSVLLVRDETREGCRC